MQLLQIIITIVSFIGLNTIISFVLYKNLGIDYKRITLKEYDTKTTEDELTLKGYNILTTVDLRNDEDNATEYWQYLFGPEDNIITDLEFLTVSAGSKGKLIYEPFEPNKGHNFIGSIVPQEYLLFKVPISETIPRVALKFKIDYEKGIYTFQSNMRNGINDRTTIPVKRTLRSFFAK